MFNDFMLAVYVWLKAFASGIRADESPERGDVPGWVLITLMTAGLVITLWALAGDAFTSLFEDAMSKVRRAG